MRERETQGGNFIPQMQQIRIMEWSKLNYYQKSEYPNEVSKRVSHDGFVQKGTNRSKRPRHGGATHCRQSLTSAAARRARFRGGCALGDFPCSCHWRCLAPSKKSFLFYFMMLSLPLFPLPASGKESQHKEKKPDTSETLLIPLTLKHKKQTAQLEINLTHPSRIHSPTLQPTLRNFTLPSPYLIALILSSPTY